MAEENSPTLALRGFRIQKKPQLSHQSNETLDTCKLNFLCLKPSIHPKITAISAQETSPDVPLVRKRIINPFSDSDSEVENHNNQVKPETLPQKQVKVSNDSSITAAVNGPIPITPVVQRNGFIRHKNPGVLEKEKQMKFLLEIFPNLEAMVRTATF